MTDARAERRVGDNVRLTLPADPVYGRIARIAASSLALRLGLGFAQVEDLRLAVDEAVILLLAPEVGADGLLVEYVVHPDALEVLLAVSGSPRGDLDAAAVARFHQIVDGLVAVGEVDPAVRRVRLVVGY